VPDSMDMCPLMPDPCNSGSGGAGGAGGSGGSGNGSTTSSSTGAGGTSSSGAPGDTGDSGGCGCKVTGDPGSSHAWLMLACAASALALTRRTRRPRR
jgi:MYXO-CTERM domain-containing protein